MRTLVLICTLLVALPSMVLATPIPDTGQTTCYAGTSPYEEVLCDGTGQDGAYSFNSMAFTDNGNGTVTDNNTGLVWQQHDDGLLRTWDEAVSYCQGQTLGANDGWRLPEVMNPPSFQEPIKG